MDKRILSELSSKELQEVVTKLGFKSIHEDSYELLKSGKVIKIDKDIGLIISDIKLGNEYTVDNLILILDQILELIK